MPELPEVEAARVLLQEHCKGKCIEKAIAADDTSKTFKSSTRPIPQVLKRNS